MSVLSAFLRVCLQLTLRKSKKMDKRTKKSLLRLWLLRSLIYRWSNTEKYYIYMCMCVGIHYLRCITMERSFSSILADIYLHLYGTNQIFNKSVIHYRYIDDLLQDKWIGFTGDVNWIFNQIHLNWNFLLITQLMYILLILI